tara:strand:- start:273 stop:533 length:261 start_codon:yes stop_codon:yes gene_type:complete
MVKIEIYTTMFCGYCHEAKQLLKKKDIGFTEIDISYDPSERKKMIQRSNGKSTVPQIFIDDVSIGGCDELYELNSIGKLDLLLNND